MGTFEKREKNGVTWLSATPFEKMEGIVQGFSTRLGGVSTEHLSSMNLSFSRGDQEENVRENFRRIADAIGFTPEDLVFSDQTHTTNIRVVTEADRGKGFTKPLDYTDVDGLITDVPGLVLATFYADCVPLYFVDPIRKAVGLSHSGWRGTVHKIGKITVQAMADQYGSRPEDIVQSSDHRSVRTVMKSARMSFWNFRNIIVKTVRANCITGKKTESIS